MTPPAGGEGGGRVAAVLFSLLAAVPLLPNPGLFTNADSPKWGLLAAGMLLVVLLLLLRAVRSKEEITVLLPEHLVLLLALVFLALLWGKRAPDARATVRTLAVIGTLTAFGIAATGYLGNRARAFVLVAMGGAAATAAIGLVQTLSGRLPTATFGNPSFAAEYVAGVLPLTVFFALTGRRTWFFAGAAACLLFLFLARSRADWAGALLGLGTAAALSGLARLRRRPPAWAASAALVAGVVALPFLFDVLPIPAFGRSDTVEIRRRIRASAVEMAADHPLTGVGLEGFRAHYPAYRDPEEARLSLRREVTFPHDLPLSVAAETGIPGLLFLLLFLFVPLFSGLKTAFVRPEDAFAPAGTGALVAILVSAQFSAPLRHPGSALLFFAIGALLVARRPRRFVTKLAGRYRRAMPVMLLAVPVVTGVAILPSHLLSDHYLAAARTATRPDRIVPEVVSLLERSVEAEPTPDALHRLAFIENVRGRPRQALALLDRLFRLSPHHELGRIERARALRSLGRLDEARAILDGVVAARPGDDVALFLRCLIRGQNGDREGSLSDLLAALRAAPLDAAERDGALVHENLAEFEPAVLRMAERIGASDPGRALAILRGIGTGEAAFYRAVVLAGADRLDEAMDALRAAAEAGFLTKERLLDDPRLEPLRHRNDFDALLRRR